MKFRKKHLIFSVALCLLLALTFQLVWHKPLKADASNYESMTITNGSFNTSPTSYYLDSSPTGWSLIKTGVNATTGVINTNSDKFNNYLNTYKLSENPETSYKDNSDTKILMINAETESNPNAFINQGYKSNEITLQANSYYSFSILSKAELGAVGSIYITGLKDTLKIEDMSHTIWKEHKIYIATGSQTEKINIELWLGSNTSQVSTNAVFFDNITACKLSETKYDYETSYSDYDINLKMQKDYISGFENSNFETGDTTGWETISAFPIGTNHKVINTNNAQSMAPFIFLGSDNISGQYALWLASESVPSSNFGYKSSTINLPAFSIYKVSFNAKVDDETTATVILKETDKVSNLFEEDYYTPSSTSITVDTNDNSNTSMNNYRTYTFYIKGHSLFDTELYLELLLGTETEAKSGSVLFDNFTIEELTQETLDDVTEDSYNKIITLETETEELSVKNGNFNKGFSEEAEIKYPITPSNWTVENNNQVSGIINTNTEKFNNIKDQIGGLANPGNPQGFVGTDNEYNNVLMMWNKTNAYQSVTSEKITLDKYDGTTDSYYNLSFSFKTLPSDSASVNFNLQLIDQNGNKIYEVENLNSTEWKNFNLYIRNGIYTESVQLKLSLGTTNDLAKGYVFIDNITLDKMSDMTVDQWNSYNNNNSLYTKTADLRNAFLNSNSVETDGVYELLGFGSKLNSEQTPGEPLATHGAISTTNNKFNVVTTLENPNDKMIYIQTFAYADYSIYSNFTFNLNESSLYKIEMNIKTILPTVSEDYEEDFGLTFELLGTSGKFEYINTNGEWVTYNTLVNVTDLVENAQFRFTAVTQNSTTGIFFIDGLKVTKLDSTEYNAIYEENKNNNNYTFVGSTDVIDEEQENADDTTNTGENFNWLIIPSLITSVALVIALVGFILRRINFKKYQKKIKTEYDRKKTLYRDVIRKQAQDKRDEELKQLNADLKELEASITALETEHKELLSKQRKEKGKKIDKEVEKSFKSYAQKRTNLENKKEKLVEKIKYVNSSDYLLELQKKINLDMAKNLKEENLKLAEDQNNAENK